MSRFKRLAYALLITSAAGLIAYPAFAHCGKCAADGKKLAAQLDENKMTLAKAVEAAEEHSKGRAISVISQLGKHDHMALHVWCIAGESDEEPKILKCYVDLTTGKVAGMKEVHEFPTHEDEAEAGHDHPAHAPSHAPHGAGAGAPRMISDQTVDAACGVCIYKMDGLTGCPLAVKIDGKAYLVEGAEWPNHDYCDRNCQAIVSGRIEGNKFIVSTLEVKQ
jgi:hypothetical protein